MCGIAGSAGTAFRLDAAAALGALCHRGPDAAGVDTVEVGAWSCTVAHTRLAINDLSPAADQPLRNEDGSLALVFNGEIYNSPELRIRCEARGHRFQSKSDGEVILHLWEDEGPSALRRLNGIFAFALLNRRTGRLVLARDPLGVKPLFWAARGRELWFASELAALGAAGAPFAGTDAVALAQFLTFLWVPAPRTPFAGVSSLLPGELLIWEGGTHRRETFCDVVAESVGAPTLSAGEAEAEIGDRVREAVNRQLLADVPIGVMASGGIDSSLLWWAARDRLDRAYTIDWSREKGGERLHEDTQAVAALGAALDTPVELVRGEDVDVEAVAPSGDLFADPAVDLTRLIARTAKQRGHKVLLSGQGGDELFGGYRRHVLGPTAARVPGGRLAARAAALLARRGPQTLSLEYVARMARAAARPDPLSAYLVLCSYADAADRAAVLGCSEHEVSDEVVWESHRAAFEATDPAWSLLRRFRAVDLAVYLPGLGLAYADRAGMQHSVEIRVPWLDLDLVRWALRLPDGALVRGRTTKWVTRSLARQVLPPSVVDRPKRGFAAPARLLRRAETQPSERGFRQARYFATATAVLERWRESFDKDQA